VFTAVWRQIADIFRPAPAVPRSAAAPRDERRPGAGASRPAPYAALAEATGDLVLRLDPAGLVLAVSAPSKAAPGTNAGGLAGRGFLDCILDRDRPSFLQAIEIALLRDGPAVVTLRLHRGSPARKDSELPDIDWVEARLHRFAEAGDGGGEGVIAVVRNITDAKSQEAMLEAAYADAENANSWKNRLLANVSHELRTPLNAIIGFSEILSSADLAPREIAKQIEYAGIIHTSAEHLLSVVNLILDISKLEAGRFVIAPEPFDVAPVVAACCDMLRLKAEEGGVTLIRAPLPRPRELIADKRAFRQIVINLLSNAVKFTKPGGQVTIGATIEDDSLLIHVEDTGIGIAPGQFPRLGDPFFQVRSSYDRAFEGTGLGLSLVRGLVGLHGGSLILESAVESGTRVTVRLPLDCRGRATSDAAPARIETRVRVAPSAAVADFPTSSSPKLLEVTQEKKIA
jgi:cell cycle sensor histidine kinase DivJ